MNSPRIFINAIWRDWLNETSFRKLALNAQQRNLKTFLRDLNDLMTKEAGCKGKAV